MNVFKYITCGHLAAQAGGEARAPPTSPATHTHGNIYTRTHSCKHTHTHIHMYTYANTYTYLQTLTQHTCTHMHAHMHCTGMCIHVHMHIHTYAQAHTHGVHTYTRHTCTYTHIQIYTYTHQYTSLPLPPPGAEILLWFTFTAGPVCPDLSPVTSAQGAPPQPPTLVLSIITCCPLGHTRVPQVSARLTLGWISLCPGGRPVCRLAASLFSTH